MNCQLTKKDVSLIVESLVTNRGQILEDMNYFDDYTEEDREAMQKKISHCLRLEAKLIGES